MFTRPVFASVESWELVDHIKAPSDGHYSLITALAYLGSTPEQRRLFIGHAKSGYCVWRSPQDYHRTPYVKGGLVCSIGSATMATDGSFIVIITLEHSTVVYPMDHDGPRLNEGRVYANEEAGYKPIVPVTLAANRMVLKGSTSGQVPVMDLLNGPLAPIENPSKDVVRVLTGYGDKVIVGLSDTRGYSSQILCYLDVAISISDFVHSDDNHPVFEVTISELEEAGCFNAVDTKDGIVAHWPGKNQPEPHPTGESAPDEKTPSATPSSQLTALFANIWQLSTWGLSAVARHRRAWTTIAIIWGFITIIVVDPPNLPATSPLKSASSSASSTWEYGEILDWDRSDSTDLIHVGDQEKAAGLGVLLWYLGSFVATRLKWWGTWIIALALVMLGFVFKAIVYILLIIPRLIRYTMTNLPTFLYKTICDSLEGYDIPVCPSRA